MQELRQTKNFVKREFRIGESKLFHNYSKFGNGNEIDIPFENIEGEKVSHKTANNILIAIAVIIYLVAIALFVSYQRGNGGEEFAWLFWGFIGTIVLGYYFVTRENFWKIKLSNDNYLFIHKNVPNKNVPEEFINTLISSRNEFLRDNYCIIDENLDYVSQLNNFRWLKSIGVISKKEFDEKYSELKRTVKPEKKDIGFGK